MAQSQDFPSLGASFAKEFADGKEKGRGEGLVGGGRGRKERGGAERAGQGQGGPRRGGGRDLSLCLRFKCIHPTYSPSRNSQNDRIAERHSTGVLANTVVVIISLYILVNVSK